jgi:plastocyanin
MMRPNKLAVAATVAATAVAGGLAVPALSSGDDGDARTAGAFKTVNVRDNVFSPKTLRIRKGESVRWVWRGRSLHNVIGEGGLRSPTQRRGVYPRARNGQPSSKRFNRTGTFDYVCTLHPGMSGKIIVRR